MTSTSREFAGDGDVDDHGAFVMGGELFPPVVQEVVAGVPAGADRGGCQRPACTHGGGGGAVGLAVVSGGFDQQVAGAWLLPVLERISVRRSPTEVPVQVGVIARPRAA